MFNRHWKIVLYLKSKLRSDEQKRKADEEFKEHLKRQKELKEFGDFKDDLFEVCRNY